MNFRSEYIIELCVELRELGVKMEPRVMELIIRTQERNFRELTKGIDPEAEFAQFLSRVK
jgi:hypothetical protein